jgi:diguanylate cyclase (GGDEF)-like protein/PAS domain S-box-containing protein
LEAALAAVTDAVVTTDTSDCITYMNSVAETLTGWPLRDAYGQPLKKVFAIVHADTGDGLASAVNAVDGTEEGTPTARHAVLVGDVGRPVIVEYRMMPIRDAEGTLSGAVVTFRDITHRRATELALQTNEESLLANAEALFEEKERSEVTLNSIGDAVISTDFRGRVSFLNIIAETMTGWTQADAAGRMVDEVFFLVDSASRQHVSCPTMKAIIENRRVDVEGACVLIRRDGTEIAVEDSATPIHDKNGGVIGAVMVAHDVTAARDLSERLARLALYDSLTELPNRTLFADRLDQALARARRTGRCAAVLFVDLDRFKPVNDSLGHAVGDQLLRAVAQRLLTCVRGSDTVSRYGGDEFVILIGDIAHRDDTALCAEKVKQAFNTPFAVDGHQLEVTASIGIACSSESTMDAETLLKYADIAMYEAKHTGRNNYQWFRDDMISSENE